MSDQNVKNDYGDHLELTALEFVSYVCFLGEKLGIVLTGCVNGYGQDAFAASFFYRYATPSPIAGQVNEARVKVDVDIPKMYLAGGLEDVFGGANEIAVQLRARCLAGLLRDPKFLDVLSKRGDDMDNSHKIVQE